MVVQRKTPTTDGYNAVQLGLMEFVKPNRINKPSTGHLKKAGAERAKFLREFPLGPGDDDFKQGDQVLVASGYDPTKGVIGHVYRYIGSNAEIDLAQTDYLDTTKWADVGPQGPQFDTSPASGATSSTCSRGQLGRGSSGL